MHTTYMYVHLVLRNKNIGNGNRGTNWHFPPFVLLATVGGDVGNAVVMHVNLPRNVVIQKERHDLKNQQYAIHEAFQTLAE